MEDTLAENLQNLENPPVLESLTDGLEISVLVYKTSDPTPITITGLAPFHTLDDLSSAIWKESEFDDALFPTYTFLATEVPDEPGTFTPVLRTWYSGDVTDETTWVKLKNPIQVIQRKLIQGDFVDVEGNKKETIQSLPRNRATLESVYLSKGAEMPTFHCFSLSYLNFLYTGDRPMPSRDWYGLFYPYFPSLPNKNNYSFTDADRQLAASLQIVIEEKLKQVNLLQQLLDEFDRSVKLRTTNVKKLYFTWKQTVPGFEGVDVLFYAAPVNEVRPFMRLLTTNTIPITKLYQPEPTKPPMVNDTTLLRTWVSERAPDSGLNILFMKALVRPEQLGTLPLFGTFRINDDGTADFTIQPPKGIRALDFTKDLGALGPVMTEAVTGMPFSVQDAKLDHADLTVELEFGKVAPRDIRKTVLERLASLGTLFQPVVPPTEETRPPLICLRYKGVANFVTEERIFSTITFILQRKGFDLDKLPELTQELAKEFEISYDDASRYVTNYLAKKEEITVTDPDAKEMAQLHNSGTDIAIFSQSVSSFVFQIYNLQSVVDLMRIVTILGIVFTTSKEDWAYVSGEERLSPEGVVAEASAVVNAVNSRVDESAFNTGNDADESVEVAPTVAEAAAAAAAATSGKKAVVSVKVLPVPKEAVPKAKAAEAPKGDQKIVAFQYLIERLKRLDPVLFNFKSQPGIRVYSSQCGSVDDRQPMGFTQEEYLRMREIYAEDVAKGKVGFIEYGVSDTEDQDRAAKGKREQITVLKYGSNPGSPNYYICSDYLCLRDVLPILKDDYLGPMARDGKTKKELGWAEKSCPFCGGTLITNPSKPEPGQTVLKRANRPKGDRPHLFVGFLAKGQHPKGYDLPCCFAIKKNISWSDPRFKLMRDAAKKAAVTAAERVENDTMFEDEELQEELEQSLKLRVQQLVNYEQLRYRIGKEYVVGPEKFPLEPGKVGLPNLAIDAYFGQNSSAMTERPSVKMEFVGTAKGLFRVGVFNKAGFTSQSLFAALAPFLGKNSIPEVAELFKLLITPRVFINLNFGNLLLEFFRPEDPEPPVDILNAWALKHLQVYKPGSESELSRFYRSYNRFIAYLTDPTQPKQMRHFVHALTEPGLMTPNGLNLITLEYLGDPREPGTQIEVSCPIMGLDINRYTNNNVGFITHSQSGVWEPMIYIDRVVKKETVTSEKEGYYSISNYDILEKRIPEVIRMRYLEWLTQCRSSYRGAFTFQSFVDNRVIVPVTRALEMLQSQKGIVPTGLLRDSYNHLVAITVKNPYSSRTTDILVPVVDDGNSFHYNTDLKVHVGVESIPLASAAHTARFYKEIVEPMFVPLSPVYKLTSFIKTVEIVAYRLGDKDAPATILMPCRDDKEQVKGIPIEDVGKTNFEFEYKINRKLIFMDREDKWEATPYVLERDQTEDLYQHVRLTFANWIAVNPDGAEMRKRIDQLLERTDLPNYEKLRRLQLEYNSTIEKWLYEDPDYKKPDFSLLRKDCLSINVETSADQCTGNCIVNDGTCKIHTPQKFQLGSSRRVDAAEYLSTRLFDEILRLPARRYELFTQSVKRFQVPRTNIHVGPQWILPENVPAWYDLIRESTSLSGREMPRYYEEFSRQADSEKQSANLHKEAHLVDLPEILKTELPPETVGLLALRILGRPEEDSTKVILRYFGMESQYKAGKVLDAETLGKISKKFRSIPVVSLYMDATPIGIVGVASGVLSLKSSVFVLIPDFEDGPAILVTKDTVDTAVPGAYLQGRILSSIQPAPLIRLKKGVKPAPIVAEENKYVFNDNAENNLPPLEPATPPVQPPAQPPAQPAENAYVYNMENLD